MSQEQRGTPTTYTECDELRDLLPAYSVGATTPEETASGSEAPTTDPLAVGET